MTPRSLTLVSYAAALGSAIVGGVFFAFSTFVMRALGQLVPAQGIAAMQAINVAAPNPPFMGVLFGTSIVSAVAGMASLLMDSGAQRWLRVSAALLYLLGAVLVTGVCNVPRNDLLAVLDPRALDAASSWSRYLAEWTAWNHVRTVSCILAAVLFGIGIALGGGDR